ncbi:histidine kinase [Streptococcus bovimastitidis]|uniref:Histidine kinase n=1 Tax=Streptococcus bovimastitidis TaxID=1856638 RepID=A0A1L8MP52_9STRE|nr:sensor histidine kinase [Streptococcus bovimastitidis]OJF72554.1 histidine kinase [Streptococcus bovimastitidis]
MRKKLSLWASLSLILVTMIALTTSIFYAIMIHETHNSIKVQETHLLTSTGKMLAQNSDIKEALSVKKTNPKIISFTKDVANQYDLDYVVVMDMKGIRLTHPNPEKIGHPFQGGDEKNVLSGKEVISTAHGSLGKSIRYLIPVRDEQKKQIGAIAVGLKLKTLNDVINDSKQKYTSALLICILTSLLVTSLMAIRLKKQLHNLEPSEIYQLLEERNAMLDQINNAVFIINRTHHITLTNQSAKNLVESALSLKNIQGQKIEKLFPYFSKIDLTKAHEQLFRFIDEDYLITISPISVKNDLRGYLILLRKAADAIYTMDQLVYTTTYASALQAQTHKFMNHLHVLYGLVDIHYYDQLKIYLDSIIDEETDTLTHLSVLIKEPLLASFLIGEEAKYSEQGISLNVEVSSDIPECHSQNQLNKVLMIFRYLHENLLSKWKIKKLIITLFYENGNLNSYYQMVDLDLQKDDLNNLLSTSYFNQLLLDTHSQIKNESSHEQLALSIKIPYDGE